MLANETKTKSPLPDSTWIGWFYGSSNGNAKKEELLSDDQKQQLFDAIDYDPKAEILHYDYPNEVMIFLLNSYFRLFCLKLILNCKRGSWESNLNLYRQI